ncbi:unnamed protein product [Diatraea saccharalis]|uniref:MYCBP-associated protein n=1 Tax=Diatraea saccharalis TaxID=40085 RepID=A0A9N9RE90_9NEOP|nr:unnamed protein product [Diatraea saccharalis]
MNEKRKNKDIITISGTIEPDRELLLWEKWIKIRQEETKNLATMTGRPPVDLTMNLLEDIREDKERKTALEHATIERKPSLRGGLWEQPLRLKQPCFCKPVYEVKRTRAEMGAPQPIEHIGVPKYIQEVEKGLSGIPQREPCPLLDAEYMHYRDKREKELGKKIMKIDAFRPDISELIIRGAKPKPPRKKLPPLPTITFNEYFAAPQLVSVYAIRINNTVIYKDIPDQILTILDNMKKELWHENCTSWTYYFKVPIKRAGRSKLYLENLGTVTLRYCWRKLRKNIPFIPEDNNDEVFFFNKNEDVIPPGQSKVLCFTFISGKPGIFSESWELSFCNICFFDTLTDKLIINLSGDSVEDLNSVVKKVDELKIRIEKETIANIVRDIINDTINKSLTVEPQIYPYKDILLESEMFIMKNPVCFYHQTEVMKMKDFYTELAPNDTWDLSIGTWRQKMMEKDYDERMRYYEILRNSHSELLKPWYEGENILKQKYRAMKWLLGKMADQFDFEYGRALIMSGVKQNLPDTDVPSSRSNSLVNLDPKKVSMMRNLFYLYSYEHVTKTIETCAGVLSSIDLNRWIQFDFCQI